ncbi:MAG: hypothetical protein CM1200mP37_2880 [Chloroflexota bacterium]|nr:MAG: hypothetical protein CM1200mP37_2880 [Chloroflexota bacterium]
MKLKSVNPPVLEFCTISSTLTFSLANNPNKLADVPGLSFNFLIVILATLLSVAIPRTLFFISPIVFFISASSLINDPKELNSTRFD